MTPFWVDYKWIGLGNDVRELLLGLCKCRKMKTKTGSSVAEGYQARSGSLGMWRRFFVKV